MDKLDRLDWAGWIAFVAYGVRLGVRVSHPEALDLLHTHLPPVWKPLSSPCVERVYSLIVGGAGPRPGVHPYPKLLSLRANGTARATKYAVEALGGRAGVQPLERAL